MKKITSTFLLIAVIAAMLNACKKDDSEESTQDSYNSQLVNATISGRVVDENNLPIQGVNVVAYSNSVSTDANGLFLLKGDVNKTRCVIQFTKAGYLKRHHALLLSSQVNYISITLQVEPTPQSISSSNGGTVSFGVGGSVAFQANSFVVNGTTTAYNGNVDVVSTPVLTSNPNFSTLIPGGDLAGKNSTGQDVSLYSYGMVHVTMNGSGGESLQLAPGATATITLP